MQSPIEYLKGVGPLRADLLKKELGIFSFGDLLQHFPHRHIDKTQINQISDIHSETDYIQIVGTLIRLETVGEKRAKRLIGQLKDNSGTIELTWFQGIHWIKP